MSERLTRALNSSRAEIKAGIKEAERDLEQYRAKCKEIEALIRRARLVLGEGEDLTAGNGGRLVLHDAMLRVLQENGGGPMRAPELADQINRKGLYRQRNGSPVPAHQIHARVYNYPNLFERTPAGIKARS
jgi:hypothetical protein